jgi:hypothetical protein
MANFQRIWLFLKPVVLVLKGKIASLDEVTDVEAILTHYSTTKLSRDPGYLF